MNLKRWTALAAIAIGILLIASGSRPGEPICGRESNLSPADTPSDLHAPTRRHPNGCVDRGANGD